MASKAKPRGKGFFDRFATKVTKATGSTPVFIGALAVVIIWAVSGPIFNYSETWQLVINTGTTIITFLMVFLIQKAQNKDSLAIQIKLNELVASHNHASNRLVDVEDLSEEEMEILERYYRKLNALSKNERSLTLSHSIDEAEVLHSQKLRGKVEKAAGKSGNRKPRRRPRGKKPDAGGDAPKSES
jgi:low affinity Fe/Cu permease